MKIKEVKNQNHFIDIKDTIIEKPKNFIILFYTRDINHQSKK